MKAEFDLERFLIAQDEGAVFERALAELQAGRKRTHWMWFIFPQLAGLGRSELAQRFAVANLAEATAYLQHPVLGARLRRCAQALLDTAGRSAVQILGEVDALKLRSSMTLFAAAAPADTIFIEVLERFFAGTESATDPATEQLLSSG